MEATDELRQALGCSDQVVDCQDVYSTHAKEGSYEDQDTKELLTDQLRELRLSEFRENYESVAWREEQQSLTKLQAKFAGVGVGFCIPGSVSRSLHCNNNERG